MNIDESKIKREQNTKDDLTLADFMPKREAKNVAVAANEEKADGEGPGNSEGSGIVNLQKRNYDLDATRYGDWELNGRCVDF